MDTKSPVQPTAPMETRHQRAWRDMRGWTFSRKAVVTSVCGGLVEWGIQWLVGGNHAVTALWVPVATVLAVAILLPVAVYGVSWATAVGRIHHDELVALRLAVDDLRVRLERRRGDSELVGRVKELRSFAEIIGQRVPPWGAVPDGLAKEVDDCLSESAMHLRHGQT
jgi:hypothetical protein